MTNEDLIRKFTAYSQARQTLPKTKQVVMLYEGMIRFMKQAQDSIAKGDIEERFNAITKVSQIITGLHSSLDWTNGGDIAKVLDGFYSSIFADLNEIQRTGSTAKCDHVISELTQMLNSWSQIDAGTAEAESQHAGVYKKAESATSNVPDIEDKIILAPSDDFVGTTLSV